MNNGNEKSHQISVSKEFIICLHCECKNHIYIIISNSGRINYCGTQRMITCKSVIKNLDCQMVVSLKLKKLKESEE